MPAMPIRSPVAGSGTGGAGDQRADVDFRPGSGGAASAGGESEIAHVAAGQGTQRRRQCDVVQTDRVPVQQDRQRAVGEADVGGLVVDGQLIAGVAEVLAAGLRGQRRGLRVEVGVGGTPDLPSGPASGVVTPSCR